MSPTTTDPMSASSRITRAEDNTWKIHKKLKDNQQKKGHSQKMCAIRVNTRMTDDIYK